MSGQHLVFQVLRGTLIILCSVGPLRGVCLGVSGTPEDGQLKIVRGHGFRFSTSRGGSCKIETVRRHIQHEAYSSRICLAFRLPFACSIP